MAEFTADKRICKASFEALGADDLLLRGMTGEESLSEPFHYWLDLVSPKPDLSFADVISKRVALELECEDGSKRFFNGFVSRFSQGMTTGRLYEYRAEVVPWLWLLTRARDCRIFQNKSVEEIVKEIFAKHGFGDFKMNLAGSYEPLPYCVQYDETDLDFVHRLLEEHGISYYFEHEAQVHRMVLFDSPDAHTDTPGKAEAKFAREVVQGVPNGDLVGWDLERVVPSDIVSVRDFDYEKPSTKLEASTGFTERSSVKPIGLKQGHAEVYGFQAGEFNQNAQGESLAKLRMEAIEAASFSIRSSSRCGAFAPGYCFTLANHFRKDFDDKYLVTRVTHSLNQPIGDESDTETHYQNELLCMPHSVPFRPQTRTPRPVIRGPQTATVVGAKGEEIDVDELGRVVVQFHWDREGKSDENSSCRVRVSQNWAGAQWGALFHPRIGQEVIVEFIDGDPDRPIITGRVYNGDKKPPYNLPADADQSGIKSRSTKGGSNDTFNEIRFEDKKDSELFYVQAQRDREKLVKNDEREKVEHDRSREVVNDEVILIGNDRTVEVKQHHTEKIGGNESLEVNEKRERSVGGDENVTITGLQSLTIKKDRKLDVTGKQDISVEGDQGESVSGAYAIEVTKAYDMKAKKITLEADDEIRLQVGKAEIRMKSNGDITISGGKLDIKMSKDIKMKGKKILQN